MFSKKLFCSYVGGWIVITRWTERDNNEEGFITVAINDIKRSCGKLISSKHDRNEFESGPMEIVTRA